MAGPQDLEWTASGFQARVPVRFDWPRDGARTITAMFAMGLVWLVGANYLDALAPDQTGLLAIWVLCVLAVLPVILQRLRHTGAAHLTLRGDQLELRRGIRRDAASLAEVTSMRVIGRTLRVELEGRADWMLPLAARVDLADVQELAGQVRAALSSAKAHAEDRRRDEPEGRAALQALSRAASRSDKE